MILKNIDLFVVHVLVVASCSGLLWLDVVRAAPTPLDMCIMKAALAVSDLPIPSEVNMLERKLWITNREFRWKVSLNDLLYSKEKKTDIPNPAGSAKHLSSFKKTLEKFIKEAQKRLNMPDCPLGNTLDPSTSSYSDQVAAKHHDLDYVVGLLNMSVKWLAGGINSI